VAENGAAAGDGEHHAGGGEADPGGARPGTHAGHGQYRERRTGDDAQWSGQAPVGGDAGGDGGEQGDGRPQVGRRAEGAGQAAPGVEHGRLPAQGLGGGHRAHTEGGDGEPGRHQRPVPLGVEGLTGDEGRHQQDPGERPQVALGRPRPAIQRVEPDGGGHCHPNRQHRRGHGRRPHDAHRPPAQHEGGAEG